MKRSNYWRYLAVVAVLAVELLSLALLPDGKLDVGRTLPWVPAICSVACLLAWGVFYGVAPKKGALLLAIVGSLVVLELARLARGEHPNWTVVLLAVSCVGVV